MSPINCAPFSGAADRSGHRRDLGQRFVDVRGTSSSSTRYLQPAQQRDRCARRICAGDHQIRRQRNDVFGEPSIDRDSLAIAATFDNAGSRASHVTDLTVPGAASRNTSSSAHRFSETTRCGVAFAASANAHQRKQRRHAPYRHRCQQGGTRNAPARQRKTHDRWADTKKSLRSPDPADFRRARSSSRCV